MQVLLAYENPWLEPLVIGPINFHPTLSLNTPMGAINCHPTYALNTPMGPMNPGIGRILLSSKQSVQFCCCRKPAASAPRVFFPRSAPGAICHLTRGGGTLHVPYRSS